ncbi:flagellar hook-basal body complex protein FliE [bacterium]|nr:flagellar hook-basal body complex protein FliE [bacterium]
MQLTDIMTQRLQNTGKIDSQKNDNNQKNVDFAEVLNEAIDSVAEQQKTADDDIKSLLAGESKNIHGTMIALEKAEITLKLMTKVRDKAIDAYREVMRMNV